MALFSEKERTTLPYLTQYFQLSIPAAEKLIGADLVGSELDTWLLSVARLRGDNVPVKAGARMWSESHLRPAEPLLPMVDAEMIVARTLAALAGLHPAVCRVMRAAVYNRAEAGTVADVQEACDYLNDAANRYTRRVIFQVESLESFFFAQNERTYTVGAPNFGRSTYQILPRLANDLVTALLGELETGLRENRITACKQCGNPFYARKGGSVCSQRCWNRIRASRGRARSTNISASQIGTNGGEEYK